MIVTDKADYQLTSDNALLTEASMIGLAPGEWPDFISVVDESNRGFLFQRGWVRPDGVHVYQTRGGAQLRILND